MSPGPASSLVLSAEDNAADTIVPRLRRLGADLSRVAIWDHQNDAEGWPWRLPAEIARLDAALAETNARLAIIDPIMAFLDSSVLCASDQSVRRALNPLMRLAERHRARGSVAHVEMDQFHLATEGVLTPEAVGAPMTSTPSLSRCACTCCAITPS